jgi:hypothetical protein
MYPLAPSPVERKEPPGTSCIPRGLAYGSYGVVSFLSVCGRLCKHAVMNVPRSIATVVY